MYLIFSFYRMALLNRSVDLWTWLLIGAIGEDSCGRQRFVETPQASRAGSISAQWKEKPGGEINSGV
jgi:hypothetical protein